MSRMTTAGTVGYSEVYTELRLPSTNILSVNRGPNTEYIEWKYDVVLPTKQPPVNSAALALLQSWAEEGDEQEQRDTWEYLKIVLDEDRLSDRKLFP